ncbi:MAG: oligoendopeptidase F [Clostridiales bacterium]|nr:oligoendopeptidase F [Clostridiales bacterium]
MSEVKKIPERSEIADEYKWALTDLYGTDEEWEKEYAAVEKAIGGFAEYPGKLSESAKKLLSFLKLQDEVTCRFERLMVYSGQKMHQDMTLSKYQGYYIQVQNTAVALNSATAFAEPEILNIPPEKLNSFYKEEPELEHYRIMINRILRKKEHMLSDKEEALLAKSMELATAASDIYDMMSDADLKFGEIADENGNLVQLSQGNFVSMLEKKDRNVRKAAFETYYKVYGQFKNSIAAMYQANVKQEKFYAQARKYGSSLEMALDTGKIPVSVYDSLLEAVHEALPDMYRYVALRKKVLGVEELHMYDVYAPLTDDYDAHFTFEEAKEMVLSGLAPMGEEYLSLLKEGFANRWIDVYENQNKRSGAYSWGSYGVHPYVLLNYKETLDNVFTLAHEMGHALHSYYSHATQPYTYSSYLIFVAEVASTCNESLLMQHLLEKCTDKKERIYLVNYFLDQFKGTLFRQTMFAEFEKITHQMYADGKALTADSLCEVYLDLNKKYFGPDMVADPQIALEWARIPHFYTAFYVYQYATGFSAAIALSKKIRSEGADAVEAYKSFLKGGSSKDPLELLKMAGVDLASPEPVKNALSMFGELVTELEELL